MMTPKIRTLLAFGVAALAMACSSDSDDGGSGGSSGSGGGATGGAGGASGGAGGAATGGAGGAATGGAGGAATGGAGGAGGSGGTSPCTALCANSDIGKCPNDPSAAECIPDCEKGRGGITKCKAEYDAFLACAASQSAANLECDSNGTTFVKSGVCAAEISAFQACSS